MEQECCFGKIAQGSKRLPYALMELFTGFRGIHIFFDKKLRLLTSTESFSRLSDFECPEFLTRLLKVP